MRHITTTVYRYSELSEAAKDTARDSLRRASSGDNFFAEPVYEDAIAAAACFGLEIKPDEIEWSGFSSQGDGASFRGFYSFEPDASAKIRDYAPRDTVLHGIADRLTAIQAEHDGRIRAITKPGHAYSQACCMTTDIFDSEDECAEEAIRDELIAFGNWIYRQLEAAYDWANSDDEIAENIEANEYEFTANGELA